MLEEHPDKERLSRRVFGTPSPSSSRAIGKGDEGLERGGDDDDDSRSQDRSRTLGSPRRPADEMAPDMENQPSSAADNAAGTSGPTGAGME